MNAKASILLSRSPSHCFFHVESVDASHPADILVASPPCLLYSKANRRSTHGAKMTEATRVVGELRRILHLLRPRLCILEQTSSLVTHCPAAYRLYLGMCQDLPYIILPYPAALPGAVDGNRKFAFLPSDGRDPVGDTSSGPLEADR